VYKIYGQLCDYTHPNFVGWQEVMGLKDKTEVLLEMPTFVGANSDNSLKLMLYLMQYTLKTFVETFNQYLRDYETRLSTWQENLGKVMSKYMGK